MTDGVLCKNVKSAGEAEGIYLQTKISIINLLTSRNIFHGTTKQHTCRYTRT